MTMKSNMPILLVEDDKIDVLSMERAFAELKIPNPLVVKNNGEDALEYLESLDDNFPCLILLDLNMPRVNGLEFLKQYKSMESTRWIPGIVLTTSANHRDVLAAYNNQAAGYIIKPLNFAAFKDAISDVYNYWSCCELPQAE